MTTPQVGSRRLRSSSNRFVEPAPQTPRWGSGREGSRSIFFEGGWPCIKARLEMRGWSPSQIEQIHEQLRQGWPLSMAVRHVALLMGRCPLRSRPLG